MRQSFFSVACPVLLSLIICYLVVAYCRFKRQISDKTQYTVSGYLEKPQHIEQYTKNSPVFGVEIKYRAVSIYSFSKTLLIASSFLLMLRSVFIRILFFAARNGRICFISGNLSRGWAFRGAFPASYRAGRSEAR